MATVATIVGSISGLVGFVCWILVLIKMFQHGQTGWAIASIVLFCCLIGYFIPFIFGWMRSREWNIRGIMVVWSICVVLNIVTSAINPPNFQQFQQIQNQPIR